MKITLNGRVDHHTYNEESQVFALHQSYYELTVKAEDTDESDDLAADLNTLADTGDILYTDFDDTEWGFSHETDKWTFHIPVEVVSERTTPQEYLRQLLN